VFAFLLHFVDGKKEKVGERSGGGLTDFYRSELVLLPWLVRLPLLPFHLLLSMVSRAQLVQALASLPNTQSRYTGEVQRAEGSDESRGFLKIRA